MQQTLPPVGRAPATPFQTASDLAEEHKGVFFEFQVQPQTRLIVPDLRHQEPPQLCERYELTGSIAAALLEAKKLVDCRLHGRVFVGHLRCRVIKATRVEELAQLNMEDLELTNEGRRIRALTMYALHQLVQRHKIARVGAAMQLVLQLVFDLVFHILWNVVAVRNVPDPRHRHRARELVGVGRQGWKDAACNKALRIAVFRKLPQGLRDSLRHVCCRARAEVPAVLLACDLPARNEGEVGLQTSELAQGAELAVHEKHARKVELRPVAGPLTVLLGDASREDVGRFANGDRQLLHLACSPCRLVVICTVKDVCDHWRLVLTPLAVGAVSLPMRLTILDDHVLVEGA
mmetsp:Transcript_20172/g.63662  ORF Transcript_20172/g.63662 Transcript_20172/m.63662 type:complete len:347 (-) Transcript_20172:2073-3113(-)